ncbi:hypothetical protein [Streptomyces triticirhizae]|uniref:Uncharacterized protein n=1 Tax=Streptomyces triticirhizae TaxID=2483353 RepID=A0A3M2M5D9_9ACTN|nr:hypothetical protein [Streptomyces triticirhizae]RMI43267.1 hypothetical protein EBN88_07705 [Streptomyces triticirhizae]RMI44796.1 hypothetical protein EBN88_04705 [Streptomyces triticirhizae]
MTGTMLRARALCALLIGIMVWQGLFIHTPTQGVDRLTFTPRGLTLDHQHSVVPGHFLASELLQRPVPQHTHTQSDREDARAMGGCRGRAIPVAAPGPGGPGLPTMAVCSHPGLIPANQRRGPPLSGFHFAWVLVDSPPGVARAVLQSWRT